MCDEALKLVQNIQFILYICKYGIETASHKSMSIYMNVIVSILIQ